MIMDFPKQGHALVIVAHPDDEILKCNLIISLIKYPIYKNIKKLITEFP